MLKEMQFTPCFCLDIGHMVSEDKQLFFLSHRLYLLFNFFLMICFYLFQYPASFALNLAVPPDRVMKVKPALPAKGKGEGMKETRGQGDEADSGRTQVITML